MPSETRALAGERMWIEVSRRAGIIYCVRNEFA